MRVPRSSKSAGADVGRWWRSVRSWLPGATPRPSDLSASRGGERVIYPEKWMRPPEFRATYDATHLAETVDVSPHRPHVTNAPHGDGGRHRLEIHSRSVTR